MNVKTMSFSRIRKGVLLRIFYKEKGMGGVPIPYVRLIADVRFIQIINQIAHALHILIF